MPKTEYNPIEDAHTTAIKAVKISLAACVIMVIFVSLSLWVMLNQITATANLVKTQKEYEVRLERLEENLKLSIKE